MYMYLFVNADSSTCRQRFVVVADGGGASFTYFIHSLIQLFPI